MQNSQLREADRQKTEFLAVLAHELRGPLAPIRNAVQLLQLRGDDAEAVETASRILDRQVSQMVRLVEDLLAVSRMGRNQVDLRLVHVELAPMIHQAVETVRPLAEVMDQDLTVTLPAEPIYLRADPARVTQIVSNLLANACKFSDKGSPIVLVLERVGEEAIVRVRDHGIGIAKDRLARIFDVFFQVDTSLERSTGGLGIGLTLVRGLVEMHGGMVEAHSEGIGHGSEFVVRLPILGQRPKLPRQRSGGRMRPRRVLIVDDNRDSASSLAKLLRITGHETHTAFDGLEALEVAANVQPDAVLLDIGLPRLNGYEVCRRMRAEPWGETLLIVALSGLGQDEDPERTTHAGFSGHLVKPVHYDALIALLATSHVRRGATTAKR